MEFIKFNFKDNLKDYGGLKLESDNNFIENFISSMVEMVHKNLDDMLYQFLLDNGYKIKKPYDMKQLKQIESDLKKQDKFVDYIEYIDFKFGEDNSTCIHHILPFFNCYSNPYTQEEREYLLESFKEFNRKEKNNE